MSEQLPLFPELKGPPAGPPAEEVPAEEKPAVSPRSPLRDAIRTFENAMVLKGFTRNTITAFRADLRILCEFIPPDRPIGDIGTRDLQAFLTYLVRDRGRPCKPKSYARRLTTLKVFFEWLTTARILTRDPAAPLVHQPAVSPLPAILYPEQIERALDAGRALLNDAKAPDPRPLFLLSLILQTGMKKSECLALQVGHFDLSDPEAPAVFIRYREPRHRHKERRLALDRSTPALFRRYLETYKPRDTLFPCTGRNLEYVLHKIAQLAGLEGGISFEMLRWTCAVRDFRAGMEPEHLRRKLGLSHIAWEETLAKIQALAAEPL